MLVREAGQCPDEAAGKASSALCKRQRARAESPWMTSKFSKNGAQRFCGCDLRSVRGGQGCSTWHRGRLGLRHEIAAIKGPGLGGLRHASRKYGSAVQIYSVNDFQTEGGCGHAMPLPHFGYERPCDRSTNRASQRGGRRQPWAPPLLENDLSWLPNEGGSTCDL